MSLARREWSETEEQFDVQPTLQLQSQLLLLSWMGKEEWKMQVETAKILDPNIKLVAHCVRIPVFIGHSEAVFIETEKSFEEKQIRELLRNAEGLAVIDMRSDEGYATPVECAGDDLVFVSRIRKDITVENGLVFWCVSDNLRKGAALNSVQIAELAVAEKYF